MLPIEIDFTLPIVFLASAIGGVVAVRQLTLLGARRARSKTARLIARHVGEVHATSSAGGSDADRRS